MDKNHNFDGTFRFLSFDGSSIGEIKDYITSKIYNSHNKQELERIIVRNSGSKAKGKDGIFGSSSLSPECSYMELTMYRVYKIK